MDDAAPAWTDWVAHSVAPFLQLVAALAFVALDLLRAKSRKEKILYPVAALALVCGAGWSIYMARDSIKESEQCGEMIGVCQDLARDLGHDELGRKYLELAHHHNLESSQVDARAFVESLWGSLPEHVQVARNVQEISRDVLETYRLRWKPLYDMVLTQFDARVEALKAKDAVLQEAKRAEPIVQEAGEWRPGQRLVRDARIGEEHRVRLYVHAGRVRGGEVDDHGTIACKVVSLGVSDEVFRLSFRPREVELTYFDDHERLFPGLASARSTADAPHLDAELVSRVTANLDVVFRGAVVGSAAHLDNEEPRSN